ncbi:MAG: COX15/CtaA family protein [Alicyclobacillaceae bacterium]|nr:COX15/CtaA family protein [Alicyclobacillaceae bacterium]
MGYRLPLVTTIAIYVLMVMGALVVGLNAGFVCPDWPLCNGKLIPPLDGLVLVEYTHRLVAALVSVLVITVAVVAWIRRKQLDRLSKWLVGVAVICIGLQVSVGALIVVLVLPGAFTTIDVGVSMTLLGCFAALTVHRWRLVNGKGEVQAREDLDQAGSGRLYWATLATALVTFAEVIFGGYFRHSGAGEALFDRGTYLASHQQFIIPSKVWSTMLFVGHAMFGMLVAGCAVWLLAEALRMRWRVKIVAGYLVLVVVDMALGVLSYLLELDLAAVTAHWSAAALLVGVSALLVTNAWHDARRSSVDSGRVPRTDARSSGNVPVRSEI